MFREGEIVACRPTESSTGAHAVERTDSQFYSPSYYPGLLRRNGLTIIARFHHLDRRFTLLPVAVTITSP